MGNNTTQKMKTNTKFVLTFLLLATFASSQVPNIDDFKTKMVKKFYGACAEQSDYKGPVTFDPCYQKAADKLDAAMADFKTKFADTFTGEGEMEFHQTSCAQTDAFKRWHKQMRAKVYTGCQVSKQFPPMHKVCLQVAEG